jgi:NAD(P)-dependent dehydrogenase (short-subunit alcohol dehydrogenase family)
MANAAKTAIVTGASRGIGAGLVDAFLKRGYNVVANSRNITKANPFSTAANVALVDGDIGDPRTAAKIVDTAVSRFGRIDVLVNNAGVFIPKPFTEYTTEDFNTLVVHDTCRLFVRVAVRGQANAAAEIRQPRQHLNDPG